VHLAIGQLPGLSAPLGDRIESSRGRRFACRTAVWCCPLGDL